VSVRREWGNVGVFFRIIFRSRSDAPASERIEIHLIFRKKFKYYTMRSRYKILNPEGYFFITSTIVEWIEIFNTLSDFQILIDSVNYNIEKKGLHVFAYVLMKNHFHIICRGNNLSNIITSIKSYSAKRIIEKLEINNNIILEKFKDKKNYKNERQYQIWQEGFHPKEIIDSDELRQKINYIHDNPVRAFYCNTANEWLHSSAKFYETGEKGCIEIMRIV